jgi:hypothetical protein
MGVVPFPGWLGELVVRELETLSEYPVGVSGAGVGFRGHENDIFGEFFWGLLVCVHLRSHLTESLYEDYQDKA